MQGPSQDKDKENCVTYFYLVTRHVTTTSLSGTKHCNIKVKKASAIPEKVM
jgi:hypothetical protein